MKLRRSARTRYCGSIISPFQSSREHCARISTILAYKKRVYPQDPDVRRGTPGSMEKKRKLPARAAARVEAGNKKRSVEPEKLPSPAPAAPTPPPPVVEEKKDDPLPTHFTAGNPLPTVEKLQSSNLPASQWQSIHDR